MRTNRTKQRPRALFLSMLEETANITKAANAAGVARSCVYTWKEEDEEFSKAWEAALEKGLDRLEDEVMRRAMEGVERYVVSGGRVVLDPATGEPLKERVFSDSNAQFLLRGRRPERYRDRSSVDVTLPTDMARLIEEGRKRAQRAMAGGGEGGDA